MIENLPLYISLLFGLTVLVTLILFYRAVKFAEVETTRKKAGQVLAGLIGWLIIQAVLAIQNVYNSDAAALPPKILVFGVFPALLVIAFMFVTPKGRGFIDSLPLSNITYIHTIRIPVEIILLLLFLNKTIPELMTFEGRNFDILAGITAPFVAYFGFRRKVLGKRFVLGWNIACLLLLANIVANALLSAPSPLQKFAFDQPNIAILHFPFSWLPTFVVPVVLFSHLVSIRRLAFLHSGDTHAISVGE